jgi:hypothetical protein
MKWKTFSSLPPSINVQYTCDTCGSADIPVSVPERADKQDVKEWLDETVLVVARAHRQRSPDCTAKTLSKLKIPLGHGAKKIGKGSVQ